MENILSIMGLDPTKINIDSKVNITQAHIDQLFAGVAPLLEKYHKDNYLKCDAECQANKKQKNAYTNYLEAKKNLKNAPQEFEVAEKKYLTLSQSGQSYINYKEKQAQKQIEDIITILNRNFTNKITEVQERVDSFKAQIISKKHMTDLEKSYGRDIYQMDYEISDYQKKNNINDRLSVYYNRRIRKNRKSLFYLRLIYWMMLTAYLVFFMIFKKLFWEKKKIITFLFLIIMPFLVKPIITKLYPVKIYIPPRPPVCPSKPITTKIPTSTPKPKPKPSVPPSWRKFEPTIEPVCPAPTIWSIIRNSIPNIGHPNAKQNLNNKLYSIKDNISYDINKFTNKIKKII